VRTFSSIARQDVDGREQLTPFKPSREARIVGTLISMMLCRCSFSPLERVKVTSDMEPSFFLNRLYLF